MDKYYATEALTAAGSGRAIGTRPVEETPVSTIEQTLKLANELAFRAQRLEANLFGARPEACGAEVEVPDGAIWQLAARARTADGNLNDAIRALHRVSQLLGAE